MTTEFTLTPSDIIAIISAVIAFIALIIAVVTLGATVYPIWAQHQDRWLLNKKLSQGPYDKYTIEQSTHYYIRPKCSNIDPAQEQEIRQAAFAIREDLFGKVDEFLSREDVAHRHLLILADSGTGKTSFVLNYYAYNQRRPQRQRHKLTLVPLGHPQADALIQNHPDPGNTVIFLDALDEDTKAIENHRQRVRDLMAACSLYKRVIMTCRTQFFPKDEEIPRDTGIVRLKPRQAGETGVYEFWKLYLSPFDDDEVERYLKKRYPLWVWRTRRQARAIADKIPLLTARPMLLAHIPDLLARRDEITDAYKLYEVMVEAWLDREIAWVDKAALRDFSERLAVNLYAHGKQRGMERLPRSELESLAAVWQIDLQEWQLSGRSLLNRDAKGNYKFSHRSIMEFLFVKRLLSGDALCRNLPLTDQMAKFLREANLSEANLSGWDLSGWDLSGANLSGANLSGANLSGAKLSGWDLSGANLSRANLSGANLSGAKLSRANFSRADFSEANLGGAYLGRADLGWVDLEGTQYNAKTKWPDGFNPRKSRAKFVK